MARDPLDTARAAIDTANASLTLLERLTALFKHDPVIRASRLRRRAARLLAKAETASPRRAQRLRARAAGLVAALEAGS